MGTRRPFQNNGSKIDPRKRYYGTLFSCRTQDPFSTRSKLSGHRGRAIGDVGKKETFYSFVSR